MAEEEKPKKSRLRAFFEKYGVVKEGFVGVIIPLGEASEKPAAPAAPSKPAPIDPPITTILRAQDKEGTPLPTQTLNVEGNPIPTPKLDVESIVLKAEPTVLIPTNRKAAPGPRLGEQEILAEKDKGPRVVVREGFIGVGGSISLGGPDTKGLKPFVDGLKEVPEVALAARAYEQKLALYTIGKDGSNSQVLDSQRQGAENKFLDALRTAAIKNPELSQQLETYAESRKTGPEQILREVAGQLTVDAYKLNKSGKNTLPSQGQATGVEATR